jgi:4'-phosphopantetheinyl transferase
VGDLDAPGPDAAADAACLSAAERARAARFRHPRDRRRFERRRARLRVILGAHLGLEPARVPLADAAHGKPGLPDHPWLQFSVSSSGGRAVYAVAHHRRVGVDVEAPRPGLDGEGIARAFFAPGEVAALNAWPPERRAAAFLRGWTRKEAYVKARGEGLARPLDTFEVSLDDAAWTPLVRCGLDPRAAGRWRFFLFEPFAGYVASLAVEDPPA